MMVRRIINLILPYRKSFLRYKKTKQPGSYYHFLKFKLLGNKTYWYKDKTCLVANAHKIFVDINSFVGRPMCYIQGAGTIHIGKYVQLGPGVGLLSANHDLYDQNRYNCSPIHIGDYSWLGMNCVITAGVELGPRTIVAAGSIVTKSFPHGFCVIAGNPAKIIKTLDKEKFVPWQYEYEFYGFLTKKQFNKKRVKYLKP